MVTLRLMAFGKLTELIAARTIDLPAGSSVGFLRQHLADLYPGLAQATYRVAVDHLLASDDAIPPDGAIVALMPPFSGG